ncbi:[LysW]-aminoadipate/[LysW]-glutamate kinase [Thermococcus argininiproducens]|uniref:[LysW]-aminoadipate/[LysW]-glutamate kinase n=1 Tax=Thermococcus argininiproducens TaxID=2866384 RepID=A0A9E7MA89_9EURY|nr:[LysW]-aminoadipate/[LysW]-glutamate kinase [Thermococcus argininiproducens]USH00029.1 [LysW]-aminoadipate/[LysW]-glutamate kinase [Thermococcus argininiproducens]
MNILKIGGSVLNKLEEFELKADLIVHGGSDYVDALCERLGIEIKKLTSPSGVEFRYTPKEVLEVYLMAVMKANKDIVTHLQSRGINAVGLSGLDFGIVKAKRKRIIKAVIDGKKVVIRDDYSGKIENIDTSTLIELMNLGIPVIAPIAMSETFEPLNVDGDKLAKEIALSLEADELTFLSDTAFLVNGEVVDRIRAEELEEFLPFAEGGMKRKLLMARTALEGGVKKVTIQGLNGRTVIE